MIRVHTTYTTEKSLTKEEDVGMLHSKLGENNTKQSKLSVKILESPRHTGFADRQKAAEWVMSDGNLRGRIDRVVRATPGRESITKH
jgi:hypothetical protein